MLGTIKFIKPFTLLILFALLAGCKKNDFPDNLGNKEGNEWIYGIMKKNYYWLDELPTAYTSTKYTLDNEQYFKSLLSKEDLFSHIEFDKSSTKADNSHNRITRNPYMEAFGFDPVFYSDNSSIIGIVGSCEKDSPAYKVGVRRGDIFNKVNGKSISNNPYQDIANISTISISRVGTFLDPSARDIVTINTESKIYSPNHYVQVIQEGANRIGYLVYTYFDSGINNVYNTELRTIFANFKTQGVTDLIIDLRYNPGGYVDAAQLLASLFAPSNSLGNLLCTLKSNEKSDIPSENRNLLRSEASNLSLNRVYMITSFRTASASELVIYCMKPYMKVTTIGGTTVGKNKAAVTFTKQEKDYTIELSPIISQVYDSQNRSDYSKGITPDSKEMNELYFFGNNFTLRPWGDKKDPLLAETLSYITGVKSKGASSSVETSFRPIQVDDRYYSLIR